MRVAIDARGINWYSGTGIGTYTQNVVKNLIDIYDNEYFRLYWSGNKFENFKKSNTDIIMTSSKHHRFFQQNYFPEDVLRGNIDIYHVPQNGIGLSEYTSCKKVITIHDLIPFIMPETVGKGYLLKFLKEVSSLVQNVDGIITVSEYSKRDILKFFPIEEERVFVTPLAADKAYVPIDKSFCAHYLKEKYHINTPYLLYIGGFSSRKNVKALINSFVKISPHFDKDYSLVIVGAQKDLGKNLCNKYTDYSKIIFTGFAPSEDLPILYSGCETFVYPSLYEGFGLPPLEAMSCGAPVITSNTTSIPEVVGDVGLLINPYDEDELCHTIEKLLSNPPLRDNLSKKGLERAANFSWEKTAINTMEAYKKIVDQ